MHPTPCTRRRAPPARIHVLVAGRTVDSTGFDLVCIVGTTGYSSSMGSDRSHDETSRDDRDDGIDRDDEEQIRRHEEEAVDAATSERLSSGVRRNAHGEYAPDPFPDEEDPGESIDDVIELHRRQADRIEHQPDVPRADE